MKRLAYLAFLILLILATAATPAALADSFACTQAPPARLSIGGTAIVVGDGLSLRALPAVSTGMEGKLYTGNQLKVIAGPSCNGDYVWWRVQTDNDQSGWIAEGSWSGYFVVPLADAKQPPTPFEVLGQFALKMLLRIL